jgi:choline dehydrogenase-like flavoprotein
MALVTERTSFTLDVLGRYTANIWQEVIDSQDQALDSHARPFDIFIVGGGTFGTALASRLFTNDHTHARRILLIEAGPLALPEHVQNLPSFGTGEVWGVPWNSDSPQPQDRIFPGLAYCLGGRSVFWGGWSPHFLPEEVPTPPWPAATRDDLLQPVLTIPAVGGVRNLSYLDLAAEEIGAEATNDFVVGALHDAMRARLFTGLTGRVGGATTLTGNRGALAGQTDLEAPLAVESTSPRPGFLPFNKFSVVPLLVRVSRLANGESVVPNDVRKRLMVLDNVHVISLDVVGDRVTRIRTSRGDLDVPANGLVFLALGTIENTRMALNTLDRARGYDPNQLVGRNLMAHMRSNLTFRVPRSAFGQALDVALHPETRELQVSALFVKGLHDLSGGDIGYFHVQVTASGVGEMGRDSEVELFKKVPDIDLLHRFQGLTDAWVVVTLRGIAEISGDRTLTTPNRVATGGPQGPFDFGMPRAMVRLDVGAAGSRHRRLWDAMDAACDDIAQIFAAGGPIEYLSDQSQGAVWQATAPGADQRRDALSSTHHESGTLWMGDDAASSVTDSLGRFHELRNLFALGPCLLPTMGSPNPVLSGLALARRTADRVALTAAAPPPVEAGFTALFDGTDTTFSRWQSVGAGSFSLVDGMIVAQPGPALGLLYYAADNFADFVLRLDVRIHSGDENSGIFVRFRNPLRRVPDPINPANSYVYDNKAFVAVDTGFEVQIDDLARGDQARGIPDGLDMHRTGAIYGVPIGPNAGQQSYTKPSPLTPLTWHALEIRVTGDQYLVQLDGNQTSTFTNTDPRRGQPGTPELNSGFLGLQSHTGRVAFRNIRLQRLP